MDLRQLRYFVATAEELHFGKAAERVHIAQPALSLQIKALEESLGTVLLNRSNRSVSLTYAGEVFLRQARLIISELDHTATIVQRAGTGEIGTIRIAYSAIAAYSNLMSTIVRAFHHQYPDVYIQLVDLPPNAHAAKLLAREIDVAFTTAPENMVDGRIGSRTLATWPIVLAVHESHPFASKEVVALAEIASEECIQYSGLDQPAGLASANVISQIQPRKRRLAPNATALLAMVSADLGVALVPEALSLVAVKGVRFVSLTDYSARVELRLSYIDDQRLPFLERFLECAFVDSDKEST
jgi:DNA-binding transcriptional LysR family regulator